MIGQTIGPYTILEKLGAGAMGEVYKARHNRLRRFVAIKALPDDRSADPDRRRRLVQEAQAASALQHPNIVVCSRRRTRLLRQSGLCAGLSAQAGSGPARTMICELVLEKEPEEIGKYPRTSSRR